MNTTRTLALALVLVASCSARTRPADVVPCEAGTMVRVGCADSVGRFCVGDPELRVCDGDTPPASCIEGATTELAFNDNADGEQCPVAELLCPASGHITVVPSSSSDRAWVCSWATATIPVADRAAETLSCTPGAMLAAGCDGTVGGLCRGDPTIRVCEGSLTPDACLTGTAIVTDDDGGEGVCPLARFTCPPSGRITVVPQGFSMRPPSEWDCLWDIGVPAI
jgi:hypothetical protein